MTTVIIFKKRWMRGKRKEGDYTFIFIVFSQKAETDNILLLLDSQDLEVCICSVNTYSWCDWKAGILWQSQPAEMNNDTAR